MLEKDSRGVKLIMARPKKDNNTKYFSEIKKFKDIEIDYKKHKKSLAKILKYKAEYKTCRELRMKHHKEYKIYKDKEQEALQNLIKAVPDEVDTQ